MSRLLTLFNKSGVSPATAETQLLARSGEFSASTKLALDTFFDSIRDYIPDDGLVWPCCGNNLSAAMLAIKYTGGVASLVTMTNNNFVSDNYAEDNGMTGDGSTMYIDTTVSDTDISMTSSGGSLIAQTTNDGPASTPTEALVGSSNAGNNRISMGTFNNETFGFMLTAIGDFTVIGASTEIFQSVSRTSTTNMNMAVTSNDGSFVRAADDSVGGGVNFNFFAREGVNLTIRTIQTAMISNAAYTIPQLREIETIMATFNTALSR